VARADPRPNGTAFASEDNQWSTPFIEQLWIRRMLIQRAVGAIAVVSSKFNAALVSLGVFHFAGELALTLVRNVCRSADYGRPWLAAAPIRRTRIKVLGSAAFVASVNPYDVWFYIPIKIAIIAIGGW
jgi:hypothetical protein